MAKKRGVRFRTRLIAMNDRDLDDFTDLLRRKFSGLKVLPWHYWQELSDAGGAAKYKSAFNLQIDYFESLSDRRAYSRRIWVEPPGWKPFWIGPNQHGVFLIANEPQFTVEIQGSRVAPLGPPYLFRSGRIIGSYDPDDREQKAFADAVIRLSSKLTTNLVKIVRRDTRETLYERQKGMVWVGHDVIRWMREDPQRTVDGDIRPVDEGFRT
jgi:hypothetical protein